MLVSGPQPVFEAVRGELEKMTGEVWYLGEQGDLAAAYKIFGNSMIFVIAAGVADVFAMAKGLGIAPADALAVFSKFQPGGVDQVARREDGARRLQRDLRADDGAEGHAADDRGGRRAADGGAAGDRAGDGPRRSRRGTASDDLGAIAAEVV